MPSYRTTPDGKDYRLGHHGVRRAHHVSSNASERGRGYRPDLETPTSLPAPAHLSDASRSPSPPPITAGRVPADAWGPSATTRSSSDMPHRVGPRNWLCHPPPRQLLAENH